MFPAVVKGHPPYINRKAPMPFVLSIAPAAAGTGGTTLLMNAHNGGQKKIMSINSAPCSGRELPRMEDECQGAHDAFPLKKVCRMEQEGTVGKGGVWSSSTPTAPNIHPPLGRLVGKQAQKYSRNFDKHTKLARRRRRNVTSLRWSDLEVGERLGSGTFSHVYEVKLVRKEPIFDDSITLEMSSRTIGTDVWDIQSKWSDPDLDMWDLVTVAEDDNDEDSSDDDDEEYRGYLPATTTTRYEEKGIYALKHLHPSVVKDKYEFAASAIDLVLEAKLLANLKHENVIKLHAVTEGSISRVFCGGPGYFLLLDRLYGTLEERIDEWKTVVVPIPPIAFEDKSSATPSRKSPFSFRSSKTTDVRPSSPPPVPLDVTDPHVLERLRCAAVGVARGLEYLHAHRIVFRDLKPSNCGFTQDDTLKIFDFGLAREIISDDYRMTANTGSLRYMAPEVATGEYYGLSADVFSFGILLYELCSLVKPFDGMTVEDHSKYVVYGGARPKIDEVDGSSNLKQLIQACWSTDPSKRPTMTGARNAILHELVLHRKKNTAAKEISKKQKASTTDNFRMRLIPQRPRLLSTYRQLEETPSVRNLQMK